MSLKFKVSHWYVIIIFILCHLKNKNCPVIILLIVYKQAKATEGMTGSDLVIYLHLMLRNGTSMQLLERKTLLLYFRYW